MCRGSLLSFVLIVLVAVVVQQVIKKMITLGVFSHYHRHQPGPCHVVKGVQYGSEDFHTLSTGETFISSGLRMADMTEKCLEHWRRHNIKGRIYLMDLNKAEAPVTEVGLVSTPQFDADTFGPHGVSVWEDRKTGRHVLFVVNHPYNTGTTRIEKFIYNPVKRVLEHQAYFSHPTMKGVNDLQATGENSFYFTNSNYFSKVWATMLEALLELPLTDVVYYDGHTYTVVDSGLSGPNGIVQSPDAQYLYVAHLLSRQILVYKRNPDNSLTRVQEYPVYTWPDNLLVDHKTGHLYVACHPSGYQFAAYTADIGSLLTPSQVLRLTVKDGLIESSQELFYDHGDLISGSSTAFVYNNTLLVGSVFHTFVTCQVNVPLL